MFKNITPNENSSDFPDFILTEGFVEHFAITSSKESKKGANHKISESRYLKKNKIIEEKLSSNNPTASNKLTYEGHSYNNLTRSFKKNWNKHIDSLEKYTGSKNNGIFLIEYFDHMALSMLEMSLEGASDVSMGDFNRQESWSNYRLSRDKDMLKWISNFEDRIEYVVFLTHDQVEIIKLSGISKLQTLLPFKYAILPNLTFRTDRWEHLI